MSTYVVLVAVVVVVIGEKDSRRDDEERSPGLQYQGLYTSLSHSLTHTYIDSLTITHSSPGVQYQG